MPKAGGKQEIPTWSHSTGRPMTRPGEKLGWERPGGELSSEVITANSDTQTWSPPRVITSEPSFPIMCNPNVSPREHHVAAHGLVCPTGFETESPRVCHRARLGLESTWLGIDILFKMT